MDSVIVAVIVAFAALFIARRVWHTLARSRASKAACNSCGCGETSAKEPLTL